MLPVSTRIVQEVAVVLKRNQHLLDRDLQNTGKALVVALNADLANSG